MNKAKAILCALAAILAAAIVNAGSDLSGLKIVRDITYVEYDRENLELDLILPAAHTPEATPLPLLMYINGGGFRKGDRGEVLEATFLDKALLSLVRDSQVAVASIDHRRAGLRNPIEHLVTDVANAVDWATTQGKQHGIDGSRIVLSGNGSGAYLALIHTLQAKNEALAGLVAIGPLLDFETAYQELAKNPDASDNKKRLRQMKIAFDGNTYDEAPERYREASPVSQLCAEAPPQFIIFSEADPLHQQLKSYREKAAEAGVRIDAEVLSNVPEDFISSDDVASQDLPESLGTLAQAVREKILEFIGT